MTHPIHAILGNVLLVVLVALLATLALFVAFYAVKGLFISLFGHADEVPDVLSEEEKALYALPIGAPRDGGNYIYTGHGWQRLTEEETEQVRENLKFAARAIVRTQPDGWEILAPETQPVHSDMVMEIMNDSDGDYDGPDDLPDEGDVERPDEKQVIGFRE